MSSLNLFEKAILERRLLSVRLSNQPLLIGCTKIRHDKTLNRHLLSAFEVKVHPNSKIRHSIHEIPYLVDVDDVEILEILEPTPSLFLEPIEHALEEIEKVSFPISS